MHLVKLNRIHIVGVPVNLEVPLHVPQLDSKQIEEHFCSEFVKQCPVRYIVWEILLRPLRHVGLLKKQFFFPKLRWVEDEVPRLEYLP